MSRTRRVMIEAGFMGAVVAALLLPASATADQLNCGPGTVKVRGLCLPNYAVICGADTHLVNGQCVPNYAVICGAGTQLVNGQCLPAPKQSVCGDGIVDPGEACDDGNTVDEAACPYGTPRCTGCSHDCSAVLLLTGPYCGDGFLDVAAGEQCDDGNTCAGDGCSATCQIEPHP